MPHPPGQLPTIYHQPFGTMPTIFLWKEQHKNDAGSSPLMGKELAKFANLLMVPNRVDSPTAIRC